MVKLGPSTVLIPNLTNKAKFIEAERLLLRIWPCEIEFEEGFGIEDVQCIRRAKFWPRRTTTAPWAAAVKHEEDWWSDR
jgi:hypothetical protein